VILDEPTNYLDRDGLGVLVLTLKAYEGGMLIISHNKEEFCDGVTTEIWIMNKGNVLIEGESVDGHLSQRYRGNNGPEVVYVGAGNKIEVSKVLDENGRKPRTWKIKCKTLSAKDQSGNKGPEVVYDGAGNKIEVAKALTEKEKKKASKDVEIERPRQERDYQ